MPTAAFGQISPQMLDPYPIESELVRQLGTAQSATALPMLNLYRSDRQLQGNIAAVGAQEQHDFARQQLQAEIQKNMIDAINTGADKGTLEILASSPQLAGMLGNANPEALARRQAEHTQKAAVERANTGLQAAYHGVQSGNVLAPGTVSSLIGQPVGSDVPLAIKTAQIGAAGDGGGGRVNESVQVYDPRTGQTRTISGKDPVAVDQRVQMRRDQNEAAWRAGRPGAVNGAPSASAPPTAGAPPAAGAPPSRGADRVNPPQAGTLRAVDAATTAEARNIISEMAKRNHPVAVELQKGYAGGTPPLKIENGLLQGRTKDGQWVQLKRMPQ